MLYRAPSQVQKPSVVISISEMLAYRDTWTKAFEENLEKKLAPPPAPEKPASKPLVVGENAFRSGASSSLDKSDLLVRLVQSTLNKITAENFEALIPELQQPALFEPGVAPRVVEKIFEKSLDEPKYAPLYSAMCFHLATYEHTYLNSSKLIRTSIVEKAQQAYEQQRVSTSNDDEEMERLRKRKLANIKFVGHLVQRELLSAKIVAFILNNTAQQKGDADVEVAITLVDQLGSRLEQLHVDLGPFFDFLKKRLEDTRTPHSQRIRFLVMNLIDLRKRKWVRTAPAEVDPATVVTAPQKPKVAAVLTPSEVATALERRPALAPDLSPSEIKDATKKLVEMTEETHQDVLRSLSTVLKDYNPCVNRAAIVAFVLESICLSSKREQGDIFAVQLQAGYIERQELRAGQAWAIANSVVSLVSEDCPKYYERFAPLLLAGLKDRAGYKLMLKDVINVATKAIDDVYAEMEGDVKWDEAYLDMWTAFFAASKAHAKAVAGVVPPLSEILDFLAQVPTTGVAGRTMTDVLSALVDTGFSTSDELKKWHTNHCNSQKLCFIVDAMSLLV